MKYKESSFFYVQSFLLENLGVVKSDYVKFIECLVTLVGAEDAGWQVMAPSFSQQSLVESLKVECVASEKMAWMESAAVSQVLLLTGFVMLGKLLNILIPHFPYLK